MTRKKWILVAGMSLALAAVGLVGCTPAGTTVKGMLTDQQEGIWVTGRGEIPAPPDIAELRLGVEAQEETVSQAQTGASDAMDRVMSALTGNGVLAEDIQTQYFNIRQVTRWDRDSEEEVVIGYRVTNTLTAKVRDIDAVGAIVEAVVEAGGDFIRIEDIDFSVDDPSEYYQEASQEAMADAKSKAEQLAELGEVRLGKPTFISEGSISVPRAPVVVEMAVKSSEGSGTPISPGEVEITLTVQVVYAIR